MRHVRQILALLLTLTLLLSVAGMAELATQGTAIPAVGAETEFVKGEAATDEGTTDEGTTDEGTTDEATDDEEALAEPIDDIASELMPVIYNPNCKHKQTKAVSKLVKYKLASVNEKKHTFIGQRITGKKCTKCGAWTEYVAGGFETMPAEKHKFVHFDDIVLTCEKCHYACQHPNAISYRWENIPAKQIGNYKCQYVSGTQHRQPVSGRRYIATLKCGICGLNTNYTVFADLEYKITAHTFNANDEQYCKGCKKYVYCDDGGSHDFQLSDSYIYADTYTYVSKDICRRKGIRTQGKYICSKCDDEYTITISYEPDAVQDIPHDFLFGNGLCYHCGKLIDCGHERMDVSVGTYIDLIASLAPIKNNGNETHSGKLIEIVAKYCPDCGYTTTEQRVVDGTQACEFIGEYNEFGEYIYKCDVCGAIKRVIGEYNDEEFSCPHGEARVVREKYIGGGYPEPNDDGKTHTCPCTVKITQYYCATCGYWEDAAIYDITPVIEPHYYGLYNMCQYCDYVNNCNHAHRTHKFLGEPDSIKEYDETKHTYVDNAVEICEDCGIILDENLDEYQLVTESHTFDETGVCTICKYVKGGLTTYPVTQITLSQKNLKLDKDQSATLTATVTPDYATVGDVTWVSDKPEVATVENGTVHALTYGVANISCTANDGSGISVSCKVTVAAVKPNKVTITAQTNKINIGETLQLGVAFKPENAASELSWKSSAPKVATVDKASGLVTGVAQGKATITVTTANKKTASTVIRVVDPTLPTGITLDKTGRQDLNLGDALSLTATLEPADTVQSDIKWISSDNKIATVEGTGLNATVTPVGEGVAIITAKAMKPNAAGQKLTAAVKVKVVNPYKPSHIEINESSPVKLTLGGEGVQLTTKLEPENAQTDLKWASSNPNIASVDKQSGFVTPGNKAGRATITVKTTEIGTTGQRLTASIVVKVIDPKVPTGITLQETGKIELPNGETLQLHAIVTPDTAIGDKLTWASSDRTIAKVNQDGLVTAKKKGTVKITVKTSNGFTASVRITVVKAAPALIETSAPTEAPSPTPESTPTPAPTEATAQQPEDEPSAEAAQEPTPEPAPEQAPVPEQAPESEPEPAPSTEQATGPAAEPAAEPAVDVPEAQTEELTETIEH